MAQVIEQPPLVGRGFSPAPEAVGSASAPDGSTRRPARSVVNAVLTMPLFHKILVSNALIMVVGTLVGVVVTAEYVRAEPSRSTIELLGPFVLAGVAVSVLVNALILTVALRPLESLGWIAGRVQAGDLDARAPASPLADRDLERLRRLFNAMLDGVSASRRRLREIAARALDAEEEERKRIAHELHDQTAQHLAALLLRLRVARSTTDAAERDRILEEAREQIAAALEGIRRYARDLRPPALDELGLVPAIDSYARATAEQAGLAVEVHARPLRGLLSPDAELALYRVVQQALSNVVRHAGAGRIVVRVEHRDGVVAATIEDDGRGFPVADVMADPALGMGLFAMQERAAYVGGEVRIDSRPGAGTRVTVEVPVREGAPS